MALKWSSKVMFPRDNFVLRCVDEDFSPSKSSGNPMITLEFEVHSPEEVSVAGEQYTVAGVTSKMYFPTIVFADGEGNKDVEKTERSQARVKELYELFGLDSSNINFENPSLAFKGKLVHALMYGDAQEQRKAPTPEQAAKRQQGDILKNPITGKPLISYFPKVDTIFGLAQADPNKPY